MGILKSRLSKQKVLETARSLLLKVCPNPHHQQHQYHLGPLRNAESQTGLRGTSIQGSNRIGTRPTESESALQQEP